MPQPAQFLSECVFVMFVPETDFPIVHCECLKHSSDHGLSVFSSNQSLSLISNVKRVLAISLTRALTVLQDLVVFVLSFRYVRNTV